QELGTGHPLAGLLHQCWVFVDPDHPPGASPQRLGAKEASVAPQIQKRLALQGLRKPNRVERLRRIAVATLVLERLVGHAGSRAGLSGPANGCQTSTSVPPATQAREADGEHGWVEASKCLKSGSRLLPAATAAASARRVSMPLKPPRPPAHHMG